MHHPLISCYLISCRLELGGEAGGGALAGAAEAEHGEPVGEGVAHTLPPPPDTHPPDSPSARQRGVLDRDDGGGVVGVVGPAEERGREREGLLPGLGGTGPRRRLGDARAVLP